MKAAGITSAAFALVIGLIGLIVTGIAWGGAWRVAAGIATGVAAAALVAPGFINEKEK